MDMFIPHHDVLYLAALDSMHIISMRHRSALEEKCH